MIQILIIDYQDGVGISMIAVWEEQLGTWLCRKKRYVPGQLALQHLPNALEGEWLIQAINTFVHYNSIQYATGYQCNSMYVSYHGILFPFGHDQVCFHATELLLQDWNMKST